MKVFVPGLDTNMGVDKVTGKAYFCCRLGKALQKLGVEVISSSKVFVDISLNIIRVTHTESKKKLLRLAGVWHDTGKDYQAKNRPIAESLRRCDAVVYQTNFAKSMCDRYLGVASKPLKCIFNGVDPEYFSNISPASVEGKRVVLAFSRWRPHKRLVDTIECFLLANVKDSILIVAGDLSKSGLTEEEYKRYFTMSNVRYVGIVDQNTIWSLLKVACVSVHLCWVDGCPNSVVEAIGAKVPVICGNVGGTKELVQPSGGFVCDIDSPYDLRPIDLYHPPKIDRRKVAEKIVYCCSEKVPVKNDCVLISNIAQMYFNFMKEIMNE